MRRTILLLSIFTTSNSVLQLHAQVPVEQADVAGPEFTMGPNYVHMPEGYFVLVRRGREIGAIRFTHIEQSTPSLGNSTYESYFQGDGSGSFLRPGTIKRSGRIDIRPLRGFSHSTMWQPGQDKLRVGRWWFGCLSPSLINMSSHFSEEDGGYEFAPTSAREIAEINASDKRLHWFRFDTNKRIKVPVLGLPK